MTGICNCLVSFMSQWGYPGLEVPSIWHSLEIALMLKTYALYFVAVSAVLYWLKGSPGNVGGLLSIVFCFVFFVLERPWSQPKTRTQMVQSTRSERFACVLTVDIWTPPSPRIGLTGSEHET